MVDRRRRFGMSRSAYDSLLASNRRSSTSAVERNSSLFRGSMDMTEAELRDLLERNDEASTSAVERSSSGERGSMPLVQDAIDNINNPPPSAAPATDPRTQLRGPPKDPINIRRGTNRRRFAGSILGDVTGGGLSAFIPTFNKSLLGY